MFSLDTIDRNSLTFLTNKKNLDNVYKFFSKNFVSKIPNDKKEKKVFFRNDLYYKTVLQKSGFDFKVNLILPEIKVFPLQVTHAHTRIHTHI